jgi:hypothetical protein
VKGHPAEAIVPSSPVLLQRRFGFAATQSAHVWAGLLLLYHATSSSQPSIGQLSHAMGHPTEADVSSAPGLPQRFLGFVATQSHVWDGLFILYHAASSAQETVGARVSVGEAVVGAGVGALLHAAVSQAPHLKWGAPGRYHGPGARRGRRGARSYPTRRQSPAPHVERQLSVAVVPSAPTFAQRLGVDDACVSRQSNRARRARATARAWGECSKAP